MKYFFALLVFAVTFSSAAGSLNDYSMLLPLPGIADLSMMLSPSDGGARGVLLPIGAFDPLPQLVVETDNKRLYQNSLKLVALRIDPCFSEGPAVVACRRQLRMVWQPILAKGTTLGTMDAAVHTFYDFDDASWRTLLQEWAPLTSGKPSDPLQIHPVMHSQTLRGPFWQRLRALLLKNCGARNLTRVTAMTLQGNSRIWNFLGFDIQNGQIKPILIPRVKTFSQLAAFDIGRPQHFFGAVKPMPLEDPKFFTVMRNSQAALKELSEADFKSVMAIAFDYENPRLHNPGTLDCVSCHLGESARRWGQQNFTQWNWANTFKNRFPNPWFNPNQQRTPFDPSFFRAFGYFGADPAISQRVFNETLLVATSFQKGQTPTGHAVR